VNLRKYQTLNKKLLKLLDEQDDLFLAERPYLGDWLTNEHLRIKYPDLQESIKTNSLTIRSVINELMELINSHLHHEPSTQRLL
jgi:hypothetical protein